MTMNEITQKVFFQIAYGESQQNSGRIEIGLFGNVCPKTVKNFVELCKGFKTEDNKTLCYKGSIFHRIIEEFMLQGGDFTNHNGTGGRSIYGEKFEDENFQIKHTEAGLLSMANAGKNTNGSQFFITLVPTHWLDGKHVVFGKVINGLDIVKKLGEVKTKESDRPIHDVKIVDCGEITEASSDLKSAITSL